MVQKTGQLQIGGQQETQEKGPRGGKPPGQPQRQPSPQAFASQTAPQPKAVWGSQPQQPAPILVQPQQQTITSQTAPQAKAAWGGSQSQQPATGGTQQKPQQGGQQRSGPQQTGPTGQQRPQTQQGPQDQRPATTEGSQQKPKQGVQQHGGPQQGQAPQAKASWGAPQPQGGQQRGGPQQMAPAGQQRPQSQQSGGAQQQPQRPTEQKFARQVYVPTKDSLPIIVRKSVGTIGRKITIETNYLKIVLDKLAPKAYHYDFEADPDKPNRMMQSVFNEFRKQHFPNIPMAFDGKKNVYCAQRLKIAHKLEAEVTVNDDYNSRGKTFKVTFKETNDVEIDLTSLRNYMKNNDLEKPLRALQCLDIVFRMVCVGRTIAVGRSFFTPPKQRMELGDGYELYTGLFQSMILGWQPYLNVDIAHKGFPMGMSVIDACRQLRDFRPDSELGRYGEQDLLAKIKGLQLIYELPGQPASRRQMKFNGLKQPADRQTFTLEDGRKLTVQQYFAEKNMKLQYPKLPCLHIGSAVKTVYVPAEFCTIPPGQALLKKLNEIQTRAMIKYAATGPAVRQKKIYDLLDNLCHNKNDVVQSFGLNVNDSFIKIPARILPAPTLEYAANKTINVRDGVWRPDNLSFLNPMNCTKFAVINMDDRCRDGDIDRFIKQNFEASKKLSMNFDQNYEWEKMKPICRDNEVDAMMNKLKSKDVKLIFVIIPDRPDCYQKVKISAEINCGMLTQCIKSRTIGRLDLSIVNNILLKVNAKLNGVNHKLEARSGSRTVLLDKPIMVIGADVTHPGLDSSEPSVVGVAASHDANVFKYNMCWRLQKPNEEMIQDLSNITTEQIRFFQSQNKNVKPQKIMYYRDGVSEGQFQQVLDIELRALYRGCSQVEPNYKPEITFIVVQKRHHTRFFPTKEGPTSGRNANVQPGTIVDTEITHPKQNQFFLVSHQSIQGTARPTKYCVLHDDANINTDVLQTFTFSLCHLFTRCNRAVSYVAPTYYAHHVASRGKVYVAGFVLFFSSSVKFVLLSFFFFVFRKNINMDKLDMEYNRLTIKENIVKGHPMFFV